MALVNTRIWVAILRVLRRLPHCRSRTSEESDDNIGPVVLGPPEVASCNGWEEGHSFLTCVHCAGRKFFTGKFVERRSSSGADQSTGANFWTMERSASCEAIAVRLSAWHAEFCLWLCFGACAIAAMMEAGSVKHAVREACNLAEVLLPSVLPRRLKCYSAGCRFVVYTD